LDHLDILLEAICCIAFHDHSSGHAGEVNAKTMARNSAFSVWYFGWCLGRMRRKATGRRYLSQLAINKAKCCRTLTMTRHILSSNVSIVSVRVSGKSRSFSGVPSRDKAMFVRRRH
jgi:hypothetical protein